jgi:hypothetical protein
VRGSGFSPAGPYGRGAWSTPSVPARNCGRSDEPGIEQWLLLDGNRFAIAAGVAVAFGLAYLVLSVGDVAPLATQALFSARTRSA